MSDPESRVPQETTEESELSLDHVFKSDGTFVPAGAPLETARLPEPAPEGEEAEEELPAEAHAALEGQEFLEAHDEPVRVHLGGPEDARPRKAPAAEDADAAEAAEAAEAAGEEPGEPGEETPSADGEPKARKARLSSAQMLHLMRLEADRAIRHRHPISCMVVGLDGFTDPAERHYRKELMPKIFHELKGVTFRNDVRGLGVWTETYQVAVFPHVPPEMIGELAQELADRASRIKNPSLLQQNPIATSVGISHNLHPGESSFETLIRDAEKGMGLAQNSGGNRVIQARSVETEIDKLKEEVAEQIREIHEQQDELFGRAGREENWGKNLIEKVIDLFKREPDQSGGVLRLEKEVIALIRMEIANWQNSSSVKKMLDSVATINRLERRVQKLTESLGVTEAELVKVAAMKNIDLGVSSLYRTVQGLSSDDAHAGVKKEMLKEIFDANVALKKALATKS